MPISKGEEHMVTLNTFTTKKQTIVKQKVWAPKVCIFGLPLVAI